MNTYKVTLGDPKTGKTAGTMEVGAKDFQRAMLHAIVEIGSEAEKLDIISMTLLAVNVPGDTHGYAHGYTSTPDTQPDVLRRDAIEAHEQDMRRVDDDESEPQDAALNELVSMATDALTELSAYLYAVRMERFKGELKS